MAIYTLTGNVNDEISIATADNNNVFGPFPQVLRLATDIAHYEFGHARVAFYGGVMSIASFIVSYDGPNFKIVLEKCEGFYVQASSGTFQGYQHDEAQVHGAVRLIEVDEYAREKLVRRIY